jgi:hypothetical protein
VVWADTCDTERAEGVVCDRALRERGLVVGLGFGVLASVFWGFEFWDLGFGILSFGIWV